MYSKATERWIYFIKEFIPKNLPEKPVPDENGMLVNWGDTKEGQVHIIDFLADEAIKVIMDRPEEKVLEFQLNKLRTSIDIWTKEWEKEFALLALAYFDKYDISESTDAYMTLYTIAYPVNEKTPIESLKWDSKEIDLESALRVLQPLSYLFRDNTLKGLKMALSGSNIYDIQGCLTPSANNQKAVLYLIYSLGERGFIKETRNMEETMKVLVSPNCSYRRQKSLFGKGEFTLLQKKEDQIEKLLDSL